MRLPIKKYRLTAFMALCCLGFLWTAAPAGAELPPALLLEEVTLQSPVAAGGEEPARRSVLFAGLWDTITGLFSSDKEAGTATEPLLGETNPPGAETPDIRDTGPREAFDHFTTGFPLTGFHLRVSCESCHVGGSFEGTPSKCVSCHASGGFVKTTLKPGDHPRTTNSCNSCHSTSDWSKLYRVDHGEVMGTCFSCHNGTTAIGKSANHIVSSNGCQDCHVPLAWS
ncbi:MAG: hypothetical protein JSU88_04830, partial [Nitrospinaceae bacterium]